MGHCAWCEYPNSDGTWDVNCRRCTKYSAANKKKWECKEDECTYYVRFYENIKVNGVMKRKYIGTECHRPHCIRNGGWGKDLYKKIEEVSE